jgi:ribokinase
MVERFDVVAVGALHLDIVVRGPRLPALDETVIGEAWRFKCGGKGGNQAKAAARAGAATAFVGRVGDDDFGRRLLADLDAGAVDRTRTIVDGAAPSGMSVALETAGGDYGAVAVSGANRCIEASQLSAIAGGVLLLQNEIDPLINRAAAARLKAEGAVVVHNMAPFVPVDAALLGLTDVVVVNRVEAAAMTGLGAGPEAARAIARLGVAAVVTLGAAGSIVALPGGQPAAIAAEPVKAASSHGAGDVFCGTLAAYLSRAVPLDAAVRAATRAATRHVAGG